MSQFAPEARNFSGFTRLPSDVKNSWFIKHFKDIKNVINNQTFLMYDIDKGYADIPYMDVYKAKIKSDGSLYKLKPIIVVRVYL